MLVLGCTASDRIQARPEVIDIFISVNPCKAVTKKRTHSSRTKLRLIHLSLSALALALAGCAFTKRDRYDVPAVLLPTQYKNAPAAVPAPMDSRPSSTTTALDPVLVEWWHSFGSSELVDLINRGLANNADVRIATLKIVQAKARTDQAGAGKGPTITVPVQASEQFPYYGVGGPAANGISINGPNGEKVRQLFQASIRGDWRVDLWGELEALAESSNLQLWRASFERDNVQGNVAANITSSYVEYLSLNDRLRVARETETVLSRMLASVEERMERGDATAIDMEQQRSAVYAVRATIPALEQQREDALGTIAFLLGTVSESLKLSDSGLDSLSLPSVIPGMPSSLLLRRPDVRMVEARMLAADADIDVARARILPPLDLTAQAGYGSYYLSELFKPQALFWNAIANLSVTIFDGGKLSKEKDYAQAVHEEMVETYVRTIYQAVREVESSLNAIRMAGKRLDAQKESVDAAHRAWDFSSEVFAAGVIDHMVLLDTERTYHQNLDEYYRIRMDRYRALVNLFHALGGGVPLGEVLPGKGNRPVLPEDSKGGTIVGGVEGKTSSVKAEDWVDNQPNEKEDCWLVELPGVYHHTAIAATWRDLKVRFPALMENRYLRPNLKGRVENSTDNRVSWYRLYVSRFQTFAAAEELCTALRASHQRCRVVMSQQGRIVETASLLSHMSNTLSASSVADAKPVLHQGQTSTAGKNTGARPLQLTLADGIENVRTSGQADTGAETRTAEQPDTRAAQSVAQDAMKPDAAIKASMREEVMLSRNDPRVAISSSGTKPAHSMNLPIAKPESNEAGIQQVYVVQLGAYHSVSNADKDAASWRGKGYEAYVRQFKRRDGIIWFKSFTGKFVQRSEADALALSIFKKEGVWTIVAPLRMDQNGNFVEVSARKSGGG